MALIVKSISFSVLDAAPTLVASAAAALATAAASPGCCGE